MSRLLGARLAAVSADVPAAGLGSRAHDRHSHPVSKALTRLALATLLAGSALLAAACDRGPAPLPAPSDDAAGRPGSAPQPGDAARAREGRGADLAARPESRSPADAEAAGPLGVSPDARWDTYRALAEDLRAPRHPSDGGGRAWLVRPEAEKERPQVRAGARARFEIVYEAGPLGIAEGGSIFLEPSPFWGWSGPQIRSPDAPGYTTVRTDAEGVRLRPEELGSDLLEIHVEGRALEAGERVEIAYGAGPARARVDRFAEREGHIWIAVDGDGDGVRAIVPESPILDVVADEPARLVVFGPSTAEVGATVRFHVSLLDAAGNAGAPGERAIALAVPDGLEAPSLVALRAGDHGSATVEATVRAEGVYRLRATTADGLSAESNPLVARDRAPPILWADLHGHSQLSDGTGTPEDYLRYARDVAGLDAIALTDHDHWGVRFLDRSPELWARIRRAVERFYEPGRFVTVLGYEWTSWLQGHRHVLYFGDAGEVLSSMEPRYRTPDLLWKALAGKPVLTFAHHSAGGPVATNWRYAPDPTLEPVTEIASVHGSSEAWDTPGRIYRPVRGNFVRDALARGYRLGFIGSGDSHDGHPGLARPAHLVRIVDGPTKKRQLAACDGGGELSGQQGMVRQVGTRSTRGRHAVHLFRGRRRTPGLGGCGQEPRRPRPLFVATAHRVRQETDEQDGNVYSVA